MGIHRQSWAPWGYTGRARQHGDTQEAELVKMGINSKSWAIWVYTGIAGQHAI